MPAPFGAYLEAVNLTEGLKLTPEPPDRTKERTTILRTVPGPTAHGWASTRKLAAAHSSSPAAAAPSTAPRRSSGAKRAVRRVAGGGGRRLTRGRW
jgi:hypothetical protein